MRFFFNSSNVDIHPAKTPLHSQQVFQTRSGSLQTPVGAGVAGYGDGLSAGCWGFAIQLCWIFSLGSFVCFVSKTGLANLCGVICGLPFGFVALIRRDCVFPALLGA